MPQPEKAFEHLPDLGNLFEVLSNCPHIGAMRGGRSWLDLWLHNGDIIKIRAAQDQVLEVTVSKQEDWTHIPSAAVSP